MIFYNTIVGLAAGVGLLLVAQLPKGAPTYSTGDLKRVAQQLSQCGARFLTRDQVQDQLPLYPKPLPSGADEGVASTRSQH